jgi:hypothetical protein
MDLANTESPVIVRAGYLVRNATLEGQTLHLRGDLTKTTTLEVVGASKRVLGITWNGQPLQTNPAPNGAGPGLSAIIIFFPPPFSLPNFRTLQWYYTDSLPELSSTYDDSAWTTASLKYTNKTTVRNLTTPTNLYASDYGYNTGTLLYRTHFAAQGNESTFSVQTQGGSAFGASVWLNETFLGSWVGIPANSSAWLNLTLPHLDQDTAYTITLVHSQQGMEENSAIGADLVRLSPFPLRRGHINEMSR